MFKDSELKGLLKQLNKKINKADKFIDHFVRSTRLHTTAEVYVYFSLKP